MVAFQQCRSIPKFETVSCVVEIHLHPRSGRTTVALRSCPERLRVQFWTNRVANPGRRIDGEAMLNRILTFRIHNEKCNVRRFCDMPAKLVVFPRQCKMPSAVIEETIERLIAILDEREAAFEDLEPDPDLEDGCDAETETWSECRWPSLDKRSR